MIPMDLDEFLEQLAQDDNTWWRTPCGDQLNHFNELLERYRTLENKYIWQTWSQT
jgi:hypothetical protein